MQLNKTAAGDSVRVATRIGERVAAIALGGAMALAGALGARGLRARWRTRTGAELAEAMARLALDEGASGIVAEGARLG